VLPLVYSNGESCYLSNLGEFPLPCIDILVAFYLMLVATACFGILQD
jgi:hypothetical protein